MSTSTSPILRCLAVVLLSAFAAGCLDASPSAPQPTTTTTREARPASASAEWSWDEHVLLHFDGLATDPGLTACQTLQLDLPAGASVAVFEVVGAIIGGTQNNPGLGVMKGYVIDPQGHRLNFTTGTGDPVKDMYATARGVLIHDPEPGIWKAFVEPDIATVNQSYWFGYSLDGTGEIQPPQPVLTDPAPC